LDEKASSGDSRLSDSREWSADTISQDEAEGGSATTRRAFTAQRVFQAIASWWNGSAAKTKLDGIQDGAQVNVATNLSYDASTRLLSSSTGDDTTLPLVTTSAAGLVPASGGGTTNFLRADGMFAAPPGGTPGGSSGQVQFNDGGVFGGLSTLTADGSGNITLTARLINAFNAAASAPAKLFSGTWFTGGTSTTTKPHVLIEPAGTASTSWNTAGTGFAVNGPSGFTGDLAWFGVAGARGLGIDSTGRVSVPLGTAALPSIYPGTDANTGIYSPGADQIGISTNGTARLLINSSGYVGVGVNPIDQGFSLAVPTPGFSGDSAFGGGVATATNSYRNFEWGLRVSGEASSALNGRCSVQYVLYPGAGGSDSEIRFVTNKYGASRGPRLTIDSTGNIGFGTTTPASLLHLADAGHVTVGTTTGTKFGTATNQKLGFFNATPIVQPASADQAALTNSTGGTANGTLSAVGNTSTADQAAVINDNFTELFRLQNEMRTALVSLGLIKGAA
jgi:hypothetical protein